MRVPALAFAAEHAWAIRRSAFDAQLQALDGETGKQGELQAADRKRGLLSKAAIGVTATIPVFGPISYRPSVWSFLFGGTSIIELRAALAEALADQSIGTIVFIFDSPGGTVTGLTEFASELRAARQHKRLVGLVDAMACSAAYWLAAQCHEIYVTPSGEVGSIGVFSVHFDISKRNERIGVKPTYIFAGAHKVEGNPDEPLQDAARNEMQRGVDECEARFIDDIVRGRGRGLSAALVRKYFGQGRIFNGEEALQRGMVDQVFDTPAAALSECFSTTTSQRTAYARDLDLLLLARG